MKTITLPFILLACLFLSIHSYSQDDTLARKMIKDSEQAFNKGDFDGLINNSQALNVHIDSAFQEYTQIKVQNYIYLSLAYYYKGEFAQGLTYLHQGEAYANGFSTVDTQRMMTLYSQYPFLYSYLDKIDSIPSVIEKAKKLIGDTELAKPKTIVAYYQLLGMGYSLLSDLDQCIAYGEELFKYTKDREGVKRSLHITAGVNLAFYYYEARLLAEARDLYMELTPIVEQDEKLHYMIPAVYTGIALVNMDLQNYEEALIVYDKTIAYVKEANRDDAATMGDLLSSKGNCLREMGRYEEALKELKSSLVYRRQVGDDNLHFINSSRIDLAKVYMKMEAFDLADQEINICLSDHGLSSFNDFDFLLKSPNLIAYFNYIYFAANNHLLRFKKNGLQNDLSEAIRKYEYFIEALSRSKSNNLSEGSNELLISTFFPAYTDLLEAYAYQENAKYSHELHDKIFTLIEKVNAQLLLEQVREEQYSFENKIPESLVNQKKDLGKELALVKETIQTAENQDSLSQEYLKTKEAYDKLLSSIRKDYPQHSKFIYNQKVLTKSDFKTKFLNEETAALQMIYQENMLFALLNTQQASYFYMHEFADEIENYISELRSQLVEKSGQEAPANDLTQFIADTLLSQLSKRTDRLLVSPHGQLGLIPLDILQQGQTKNFLVSDLACSVHNSFTHLDIKANHENKKAKTILSLAPDYEGEQLVLNAEKVTPYSDLVREGLHKLPNAIKEASDISEIFDGDCLLNESADKKAFISKAKDYSILHLAMHGLYMEESKKGQLVFYQDGISESTENYLSNIELSNLNLNSDLVTLSACNTGLGKNSSIKGIESLGNALDFAGVKSHVISLWSVPDASTSTIMVAFYKQLKLGVAKDKALQKAKLEYLENETIPAQLKHPYYWAGFVLHGETGALNLATNGQWLYGLGALVGMFLLYFLFRPKSNSPSA